MTNREHALNYLKSGFSIFPTKGKIPLVEWKKYQIQKPTEDQIEKWWSRWPDANIAVATGAISDIIVVDIDGGEVPHLPPTAVSETSSGHYQYFFKYPGFPVQNSAKVIASNIDFRGDGGFVVLPPSRHFNKVTGQQDFTYSWSITPKDAGFADLPESILEKVRTKKTVSDMVHGVPEGGRNNSAAAVAGKLLRRFKEEEWESEAWPLFQAWNKQNNPPLLQNELRATFDSISAKERSTDGEIKALPTTKPALIADSLNYVEVENKVKELLPDSQTVLKLVLAVAISSHFQNPVMLWLLLVGVPSSGKTDMVRLVKDCDASYYLDNLTQNSFISGERASKSNKVHDLLPLLDKKCLIIKDWTSIFSLDEKMTKKLLGDLVGIYDKEFTKFSSRRGNISYSSAFSQLGCITPATLNRHTSYMNMVGPRFLCYTMPPTAYDAEDKSYKIIFSDVDRSLIDKEARLYVSSYLNQLTSLTFNIKPLSDEVQQYLRLAAKLMAGCRGIVILQSASFKNEEGEEVKYYEVLDVQIEEPWRAVQQLVSLAKYLAFVVGKNEVGIEELAIIKEVVISSMPAERSQALRVIKEHGGEVTAKELADLSEKSTKTSRRLLDELVALKALEKIKGAGNMASDYKVADQFRDFLLLDTAEFVSAYSCGTETPHSIPADQPIESLTSDQQLGLTKSVFGEGTKWEEGA